MKYFAIYLLFSLFINLNTYSQEVYNQKIDLRIPPKEKIEKYIESGDFQYDSVIYEPNWWDKFKYWLTDKLGESLNFLFDAKILHIAVVIMLIMLIVWLILKSQSISIRRLLQKQKLDIQDIEFVSENINEIDLDKLIEEAKLSKNYRLAIRFSYLKILKSLSENMIIKWNPNKTNYSYQHEIENPSLRSKFLDITLIFDYVWYGEFDLNEQNFEDAYVTFDNFNKMITNEG